MANISVTPQGQIYLCKTPLVSDYKHQLTFSNLQAQLSYFNSKIEKTFDNYTYIKHDNMIKVGENIDNIINCNYLFYKNTGFTNKYYFCFITNMEYINENCTAIYFTTDVFQTWQFDINYHPCFVEREHVNDDTIGAHTVEENLNVGEVICESIDEYNKFTGYYIAVGSTYEPSSSKDSTGADVNKTYSGVNLYNGQVFGDTIFLFDTSELSILGVTMFIEQIIKEGHASDISSMFIVPKNLFDKNTELLKHTGYYGDSLPLVNYFYYVPIEKEAIETDSKTISKTHSFSGFTPRNNKCYCYPYNYLYVTNHVGNDNILKYEDFSSNNCVFDLEFAISIGGSGRMLPKNYKNIARNYNESIIIPKFPTCSWSGDAFTNWLTQNAVNIPTQIANIGVNTLTATGSAITGNMTGGVMGGISVTNSIASLIGEFYQASLLPAIKQGTNNADINYLANRNKITFYHMRVKTEFLQVIDNYFTMFGYKINRVKSPNITGRNNWNYVKTTNANFTGNIPQSDILQINNMFNNGVTLWHNPNNMYNYSSNNSIV